MQQHADKMQRATSPEPLTGCSLTSVPCVSNTNIHICTAFTADESFPLKITIIQNFCYRHSRPMLSHVFWNRPLTSPEISLNNVCKGISCAVLLTNFSKLSWPSTALLFPVDATSRGDLSSFCQNVAVL